MQKTKPRKKSSDKAAPRGDGLPAREDILAFIADHPGEAGKREVARAFGITGSGKIALKRMLRELADEGLVTTERKRLRSPDALPTVSVLAVTARTADGDLVAEPSEWDEENGPAPRILLLAPRSRSRGPVRAAPAAGVGDRVLARLTEAPPGAGAGYTARIIKVLERRPATVLGVVRRLPEGARLEPVERKQREMFLAPGDIGDAQDGDLVTVSVSASGRDAPQARVTGIIGSMKSEKAVSQIALLAHGIPHVFPAAVLAEADKARRAPLAGHEDWRELPLVTIDPPDAKDHDDAVHAAPDDDPGNPGGWIVTVAIADVAWYVRPASALDREARLRGNSVYFPDRVVPMLPERISNDLCSLREGEDRPAMAVRMIFSPDGRKLSHRFHRIMMRSAAKLSYAEAQDGFDGRGSDRVRDLTPDILAPLWQAYRAMKVAREARHPLDLDIPERKVIVGPDGHIDRILIPERLEAHRLIEEFMIQANVAAAETLEKLKSPLVYRIHDAPSLAKLDALRQFLASIDVNLPKSGNLRPSHFNQILDRLKETEHGQIIHEVVLRTQSQAEYNPANIGHFGLNLRRYAHFTSPIRRYADLIVHRALIAALGLGQGGLPADSEAELAVISAEISAAERRAMAAERETIDRLVAHWLADRIGATFRGRIAGVTGAGLFVKLDETGADGFVPISTLGNDYFVHDEIRHSLTGRQTGETYRLGDPVEVRLVEVAPVAGALRFEMLTPGSGGESRRGRARSPRERDRRGPPGRADTQRKGAAHKPGRKRRS